MIGIVRVNSCTLCKPASYPFPIDFELYCSLLTRRDDLIVFGHRAASPRLDIFYDQFCLAAVLYNERVLINILLIDIP